MRKIIVIFVTLLVLCACDSLFKPEKVEIITERKPVLQNNEVVCFKNEQDNTLVDAFKITRKDDSFVYDRATILERITLSYTNVDKQAALKKLDVYLDAFYKFAIYDYAISNDFEKFDIEINEVSYTVFAVKSRFPKTSARPDSIYYSYREGILRYFYSDTIYTRIF